jgi:hypothetical protein
MSSVSIITRRSSRIADKRNQRFKFIHSQIQVEMKSIMNFALSREKRCDSISNSYEFLRLLFILHRDHYISLPRIYKLTTPTKFAELFKIANTRIPRLIDEITKPGTPKYKYVNRMQTTLTKFKDLYETTNTIQIYKAVMFSRVEIPQDVFKLVMEYYIGIVPTVC